MNINIPKGKTLFSEDKKWRFDGPKTIPIKYLNRFEKTYSDGSKMEIVESEEIVDDSVTKVEKIDVKAENVIVEDKIVEEKSPEVKSEEKPKKIVKKSTKKKTAKKDPKPNKVEEVKEDNSEEN